MSYHHNHSHKQRASKSYTGTNISPYLQLLQSKKKVYGLKYQSSLGNHQKSASQHNTSIKSASSSAVVNRERDNNNQHNNNQNNSSASSNYKNRPSSSGHQQHSYSQTQNYPHNYSHKSNVKSNSSEKPQRKVSNNSNTSNHKKKRVYTQQADNSYSGGVNYRSYYHDYLNDLSNNDLQGSGDKANRIHHQRSNDSPVPYETIKSSLMAVERGGGLRESYPNPYPNPNKMHESLMVNIGDTVAQQQKSINPKFQSTYSYSSGVGVGVDNNPSTAAKSLFCGAKNTHLAYEPRPQRQKRPLSNESSSLHQNYLNDFQFLKRISTGAFYNQQQQRSKHNNSTNSNDNAVPLQHTQPQQQQRAAVNKYHTFSASKSSQKSSKSRRNAQPTQPQKKRQKTTTITTPNNPSRPSRHRHHHMSTQPTATMTSMYNEDQYEREKNIQQQNLNNKNGNLNTVPLATNGVNSLSSATAAYYNNFFNNQNENRPITAYVNPRNSHHHFTSQLTMIQIDQLICLIDNCVEEANQYIAFLSSKVNTLKNQLMKSKAEEFELQRIIKVIYFFTYLNVQQKHHQIDSKDRQIHKLKKQIDLLKKHNHHTITSGSGSGSGLLPTVNQQDGNGGSSEAASGTGQRSSPDSSSDFYPKQMKKILQVLNQMNQQNNFLQSKIKNLQNQLLSTKQKKMRSKQQQSQTKSLSLPCANNDYLQQSSSFTMNKASNNKRKTTKQVYNEIHSKIDILNISIDNNNNNSYSSHVNGKSKKGNSNVNNSNQQQQPPPSQHNDSTTTNELFNNVSSKLSSVGGVTAGGYGDSSKKYKFIKPTVSNKQQQQQK